MREGSFRARSTRGKRIRLAWQPRRTPRSVRKHRPGLADATRLSYALHREPHPAYRETIRAGDRCSRNHLRQSKFAVIRLGLRECTQKNSAPEGADQISMECVKPGWQAGLIPACASPRAAPSSAADISRPCAARQARPGQRASSPATRPRADRARSPPRSFP